MNEINRIYSKRNTLTIYKKKYSKKYIEIKYFPIINYIELSVKINFYLGALKVLVNHHLLKLLKKL